MEGTKQRRAELLEAAKAGDRDAFDAFFEENQGLVRMVVSRFMGRDAEYDDLFQVACMAFVKAVAGFDLSAGVQFSTYAVPVMLGELRRYFRDNGALRVSRTIKEQAHQLAGLRESLSFSLGFGARGGDGGACARFPGPGTLALLCRRGGRQPSV